MILPKSVLIFFAGCGAGVIFTAAALNTSTFAHAATITAGPFIDVPASHVAAPAVAELKTKGIVAGYDDGDYHGSQPVTRYELAVILARFVKYYDKSTQPLATSTVPLPTAPGWAAPSREFLAENRYVPAVSPLFKNPGGKSVTADQLADNLSTVYDRIADRSLPPQAP